MSHYMYMSCDMGYHRADLKAPKGLLMENTTQNNDNNRPIGYWLRAVDRLITREFATALETEGVTRREWMILNVLDGSIDAPEVAARIERGGKRLRHLAEHGWIAESDGSWTLTDDGRAAKARLAEAVGAVRAKVAGAVAPEDFATTLASLEAIARELGWDENERMPRGRGFGRRGFGPRGFGHRGFGPGLRPGFGPDDRESSADEHGEHPHGGHAHGRPDCGQGHRRGRHHDHRHAERAYERGFDAGFARGRTT